jgi:hypothetical protein
MKRENVDPGFCNGLIRMYQRCPWGRGSGSLFFITVAARRGSGSFKKKEI